MIENVVEHFSWSDKIRARKCDFCEEMSEEDKCQAVLMYSTGLGKTLQLVWLCPKHLYDLMYGKTFMICMECQETVLVNQKEILDNWKNYFIKKPESIENEKISILIVDHCDECRNN
jgi:ferredoxin-like protein FixX